MNRTRVILMFLTVGVLAMQGAFSVARADDPTGADLDPGDGRASDMGPFLEIWTDAVDNREPAVAYNSLHDEYLVVWHTEVDEWTWDIWARRVGTDGSLRSWFNVDSVEAAKLFDADVAYSPAHDEYLIVYTREYAAEDHDIYARIVEWDSVGENDRIYVDTAGDMQGYPSVAYNNQSDDYVIVYEDETTDPYTQVLARLVDASDGTVSSGVSVASGTDEYRGNADVAYNPERNNYLVVYGFADPSIPRCFIACKTASADLSSFSPEFQVSGDVGCGHYPAVAAGPDEFLATWHTLEQVYGRRVGHDGMPVGPAGGFPLPMREPEEYRRLQDVAWIPAFGYLVVWEEFDPYTNDESDVFGRYVREGANEATGSEFLIDGTPHYQSKPAVACAPGGNCLVVWEHNANAYPAGDEEIRGRLVSRRRIYLPLVSRG